MAWCLVKHKDNFFFIYLYVSYVSSIIIRIIMLVIHNLASSYLYYY